MKNKHRILTILLLGFGIFSGSNAYSDTPAPEKKYEDFNKVVAGAKTFDGLFKLHLKDEHLYAELRMDQFNHPFLAPIAVARGAGMGGYTLNFDEQWVLMFKRVGEKVQLIRRNVHFKSRTDLPVARAVETTYTDSVLLAIPIRTMNLLQNTVVIDLNSIFMSNFAELPFGMMDSNRSTWGKVKAFPKNIELEVSATFTGGRMAADDSVIDSRGNTIVIHYSLMELPEAGYQPRLADDRVGHFLTAVKDFSRDDRDTSFIRYVNRWRLERVDGSAWKEGGKLVPPKKKIIFWIEKSVPDEYRAAVREGILEWNKAFEKIGFRDAIEVRQQEAEDFEPEDVNYSTLRWITTDQGFAMGPSRVNPFTGEIIDADIIFDASMVRFYKQENQLFRNEKGLIQEPASLIEATRKGWSIPNDPLLRGKLTANWNDRKNGNLPPWWEHRSAAIQQGICQCGSHKSSELGLALMAMAARINLKPNEKLPEEMIQQAVKETVMHEVGHTLGLRHNFKASTYLRNDQLHDTNITRKQGLVASVMDYNPVNLAPKGVKQGDYFTTTIGAYDYWAIEYAYKPLSGGTDGEAKELGEIASRCAEPGLDYGTDEDLSGPDPSVNVWDLGADSMKYAQDRMLLSEELMKGLAERIVDKGEGYHRARIAFSLLLRQYGDGAYLTSQYVGGEYMNRDHKGDKNGRDPFVPVRGLKQREALKFLQEKILTDKPFQFPPELLRKLAADRWLHWGNEYAAMSTDSPLHERVLGIQRVVLNNLLSSSTLSRIQNLSLKAEANDQSLTISEVFRALTESIFSDLPNGEKAATSVSSIMRRNLQREYLSHLNKMILGDKTDSSGFTAFFRSSVGNSFAPDARSLARMHLREISKRMDQFLKDTKSPMDDTVRAHLEESKEVISKILNASMQVQQP